MPPPYGGVPVFADWGGISFSLNLATNTGAAWSLFSGYAGLLFLIRAFVIAGLIGYLVTKRKEAPRWLWLVAVGALGNALDYLLYGHVIDFFHFVFWGYSFPIFNVADSLISIGVAGVILFPKRGQQHEPA